MKAYSIVKKIVESVTNKKKSPKETENKQAQPGYLIGEYRVVLSETIFSVFKNYIQDELHKNESGGLLLGAIVGNTIYVSKASIPSKFDKATRTSFHRDKDIAQIIVDYEFENSGGKMFYVGEWHTHPEDYPTPSGQDRKMTIEQYNKSRLSQPFSLMIIQGKKGVYLALYDGNKIIEPANPRIPNK